MNLYHAIGMLFTLLLIVCWVIVMFHAFKQSLVWGLLCLCMPCPFGLYYVFVKFEHEYKGFITIGYIVGLVGGGVFHGWGARELLRPMVGGSHQPHRRKHPGEGAAFTVEPPRPGA